MPTSSMPGFHSPVQRIKPPPVVGLYAAVHLLIGVVMVGFLEDLVGADAHIPQDFIVGYLERGGIHIDTAISPLPSLVA